MEVEFVKISPTQNMTILVTTPVERKHYRDLAEKIMAYDSVHAEQVGFVEKPENPKALARLQMAGGEFCGNAALSLCAYLVWKGDVEGAGLNSGLNSGLNLGLCPEQRTVPIEVSGSRDILFCEIKKREGYYLAKFNMPVPESIGSFDTEIAGSLPVVYMPGISHVIVDTEKLGVNKDQLVASLLSNHESFTKEDAFGIMFYDNKNCSIEPFVYVKTAGTKIWERGCASGSASIAAYMAHVSGKSVKLDITQPGGVITAEVNTADGKITGISVEGKIVIVAQGKAFLK